MFRYNKQLIEDYVKGNDLCCDLEILEDDADFMLSVMKYTRDKNIYKLCSDRLLHDYEFNKQVIKLFADDIDFASEVAYEYVSFEDADCFALDIILMMKDLTRDKNQELYEKYDIMSGTCFTTSLLEIEIIKYNAKNNEEFLNDIGMGFWFIFDQYNGNERIMKFFSERFIDLIFDSLDSDLELFLHEQFDTLNDVNTTVNNCYLLSFIRNYDVSLADYATCHLDVLDKLKSDIDKVKNRWEYYCAMSDAKKYNYMIEWVHNYMQMYEDDCSFCELQVLYSIGKEFGVAEKIKKYDVIDDEEYQELLNDDFLERNDLAMTEKRHYNNIKRMMKQIIEQRNPNSFDDDGDNKGEDTAKLMSLIRNYRKV